MLLRPRLYSLTRDAPPPWVDATSPAYQRALAEEREHERALRRATLMGAGVGLLLTVAILAAFLAPGAW